MEISKEVIKAYALENAIKYNGKASPNAVLSALFAEGLEKSQIKEYFPKIQKIVQEINSLSLENQKEELKKIGYNTSKRIAREGLPELQNTKKEVVMRFAPFPSGPLHIGNARTLILNDEYVKSYNGRLLLVMDDTIGSKEKQIEPSAYKLIKEGVEWLGVKYDKVIYKSDRLEKYYAYAEELIKKGYMYVCTCPQKEIQELRKKGIECSCRQLPPIIHQKRWKEMFTAKEGSMCVRLKTDMQDPDPAFRDRIMFRISDREHPRLKKKYRVYPLLDFSWAIDDHLLGVTHILRGTDLVMETRVEKFIWDIFKWEHPEVIYNGHLSIEGIKISKSKGAKEVKSGIYIGWNDPRTWSLQSLRDRGILPQTIREFIISLGIKKTSIKVPIEVLYSLNRKHLNDAPRYFFVENPVKIKINGAPPITAKIPLHPNKNIGERIYPTKQIFYISEDDLNLLEEGREYRLMHLMNFKTYRTNPLNPLVFSFVSEEPEKIPSKFLHWIPGDAQNVKIEIRMPDNSIKKGLGEPEIKNLKQGDIVQFERVGFAKLYKKHKDYFEFWFAHI